MSQEKRILLRTIRKATKPKKGFGQWVLVVERRKVTDKLGLYIVEAELNGKSEWSASMTIGLPVQKKTAQDEKEIQDDWDQIEVGKSVYNVFTLELRGKTVIESAKDWLKRSVENGKLQDLLPFVK